MKKSLTTLLTWLIVFNLVSLASAQMVNQQRRAARQARKAGLPPPSPQPAQSQPAYQPPKPQPVKSQPPVAVKTPSPKATPAPVVTPEPVVTPISIETPAARLGVDWATTPQEATSEMQKKSDINGDGKLQPFETKIYLRDLVDQINSEGNVSVDSDILKVYDKNSDGMIDASESTQIVDDVNK